MRNKNRLTLLICEEDEERSAEEKKLMDGVSFIRLHEVSQLIKECKSFDLFSSHLHVFFDLSSVKKEEEEEIMTALSPFPAHLTLIFSTKKMDHRSTFYKWMKKEAVIIEPSPTKPWEMETTLVSYLLQAAKEMGALLSQTVALELVRGIGNHRLILLSELEKLKLFAGEGNQITIEHVRAISTIIDQTTAWKLSDALMEKKYTEALLHFNALLEEGHSLYLIFRQVRASYHQKLMMLSLALQEGGMERISFKFPQFKGPFLQKHLALAKNVGLDSLSETLILLDRLDAKLKSETLNERIIGEYTIGLITS